MKILFAEKTLCTCCMNEHELRTVRVEEHITFKDEPLDYMAEYYYCDVAEEYFVDERMFKKNDTAIKDAYRMKTGLLTSEEICGIRKQYDISQSDLCVVLGWGGKTITRYESHQVQDKAHDLILKKVEQDPEWFLHLLVESEQSLPTERYKKYVEMAALLYEKNQDNYLRKAIEARYAGFYGKELWNGNAKLDFDKIIDVICFLSNSEKVTKLYKVKLMKLLWYADAVAYKRRKASITGLVYQAVPMGAVPVAHESIMELKGVPCEMIDNGDTVSFKMIESNNTSYLNLTDEEKNILNYVIDKLGEMSKDEIVSYMHKEEAYQKTKPRSIISFKYVENLSI